MVYVTAPVAPARLEAGVSGLRALGVVGANVTLPHKQAVLPLMDTLSPQAKAVGAVNTIVCQREDEAVLLHGDNTDIVGFLQPLHTYANALHGTEMVILGAGGAARAVVYGLLTTFAPTRLTLAARRIAQAEALVNDLAAYDAQRALRAISLPEAGAAIRHSRLLVNTTPAGMHPHLEYTPWSHTADFHANLVVYDLVYNPERTRLLHDAQAKGAQTIGGLDMLVAQAAASYVQWTGRTMPIMRVRNALTTYLHAHTDS